MREADPSVAIALSGAIFMLNGTVSLRIAVARCRYDAGGLIRWRIRTGSPAIADFILVARLNHTNSGIHDYYLFRTSEFPRSYIVIRDERPDELAAYCYPSLRAVFWEGPSR
jgi:hypothetical protein